MSAGDTLSLRAERHLVLDAGENQEQARTAHNSRNGLNRSSSDVRSEESTLARTTLSADQVKVTSGGDMTLAAVDVNASSLDIHADRRLNLATRTTHRNTSLRASGSDVMFQGSDDSGREDQRTNYNRFDVFTLEMNTTPQRPFVRRGPSGEAPVVPVDVDPPGLRMSPPAPPTGDDE